MSLPPIPKRKGMVAHSAAFRDGEWRHVLYRPEGKPEAPEPAPARRASILQTELDL